MRLGGGQVYADRFDVGTTHSDFQQAEGEELEGGNFRYCHGACLIYVRRLM